MSLLGITAGTGKVIELMDKVALVDGVPKGDETKPRLLRRKGSRKGNNNQQKPPQPYRQRRSSSSNKGKVIKLHRRPDPLDLVKEELVWKEQVELPSSWFSTALSARPQLDTRLVEEALSKMELYRKDPLRFVSEQLKIPTTVWKNDKPPATWKPRPYSPYPLWSKQREILRLLVTHRKVAVKSGHGVGKTFIAAVVALYLAYAWHALGITTAPTHRQVEALLWGEIRDVWNTAQSRGANLGGRLLKTQLQLGDKWFVMGFSTDDPEANIPGFHEENVFVIVDEACGVDPKVYDMLDTILTSENSFALLIGNPVDPRSPFADCFKPGSGWAQVTISCYDSPNVKNGENIYKKLVAWDWPLRMRKKWGPQNPLYKARVKAEFPEETSEGLIPYWAIQKALDRELPEDEVLTFGVDVGRQGGDRSVIGCRWKSGRFRILDEMVFKRETELVGKVNMLYHKFGPQAINVDDIGVGGGVTDMLWEQELPVNGVEVSEKAENYAEDTGEAVKFANLRAWGYWKLREAFIEGRVDIDDEELAQELCCIPMEITSTGKIKIPEKDRIKKLLGGRSPDKADAMMLAWVMDYADEERELLRFIG